MTDGITPTSATFDSNAFEKINNARDATSFWEHAVEGAGTPVMEARWAAAEQASKKYGGSTPAGSGDEDSERAASVVTVAVSRPLRLTATRLSSILDIQGNS